MEKVMVEAAGVERFFEHLNSITCLFSIAYKSAKMPKMPLSWYSFWLKKTRRNARRLQQLLTQTESVEK
ncbi:MAG: hypothetical protein P4L87_21600 [Formivibrio sp.]|nr:hypothetical protein [Formivibrio sp.]